MKIKELIKALEQFDGELDVFVFDSRYDFVTPEIESVIIEGLGTKNLRELTGDFAKDKKVNAVKL